RTAGRGYPLEIRAVDLDGQTASGEIPGFRDVGQQVQGSQPVRTTRRPGHQLRGHSVRATATWLVHAGNHGTRRGWLYLFGTNQSGTGRRHRHHRDRQGLVMATTQPSSTTILTAIAALFGGILAALLISSVDIKLDAGVWIPLMLVGTAVASATA